jgi:ActR/RegA family two-component response regulator
VATVDVLVVDDDEGAGQEYRRLIERETSLNVLFTDSVPRALDVVRSNPVKVAVLDQRMGASNGTTVFAEIKAIDQRVRAVMFTGLASAAEVGEALAQGYAAYVSKADVAKLGAVVLEQFMTYQMDAASAALRRDPAVLLRRRHGLWPARREVVYTLLSIEVLDERFVEPESWKTVVSLQAGEEQKFTESIAVKAAYGLEAESQRKLTVDLGLKPSQLETLNLALKREITERLKASANEEVSQTRTWDRSYKLPSEPDDPNKIHVKSRRIEHAPITRRLRVAILAKCGCCGLTNVMTLTTSEAIKGTATRHVDTLSDGEVRTIDTGIER